DQETKPSEIPLPKLSSETVFEDTYNQFIFSARRSGLLTLQDIIDLIQMLQEFELDCHVVVAGQNGIGKSYVLLMLLKMALGKDWQQKLMLAKHT
ncbi:hypothetical protein GWN43_03060, partial [Candidatus Bathyarchaeota archaeon]|nr:hypothetical protein [Candidatus Bathyarchaeota archaeon]